MRILNADQVRTALPMNAAIEAMKTAFAQLSKGEAVMPLRSRVNIAHHGTTSLIMPAYLNALESLAVKIVSIAEGNPERGLPSIHAVVIVLDPQTGIPLAILEGGSLTAIRTGAGSGAATDLLARPDSKTVAVFGSGVQARTQLEAVCTVRAVESVRVFSPNLEHAARFAKEMAGVGPIPTDFKVVERPDDALFGADIVCTATSANAPVFDGRKLEEGVHINAVGSYTPDMQEVDEATILASKVVVDSREAVIEEAGDLLVPIRSGRFSPEAIHAELGEIVNGERAGRESPSELTYFKSVGVAVQDAAAGALALERAEALNLGQLVEL